VFNNDVNGVSIRLPGQNESLFALARDFSAVWTGPSASLTDNQWNHTVGESVHGDSVALSWQGIRVLPGQTVSRVLYFVCNESFPPPLTSVSGTRWDAKGFLKIDREIRPLSELAVTRRGRNEDFDLFVPPPTAPQRIKVGILIHFDRFCVINRSNETVTIKTAQFAARIHLPGVDGVWAGSLDKEPSMAFQGDQVNFEYSGQNGTLAFSWPELDLMHGSAAHLSFSAEPSDDKQSWLPPVLIIGLMIPNLLVPLICLCSRGSTATFFTIFGSLTLNAGHGCMILDLLLGYEEMKMGMFICYGLWGLILVGGLCCEQNGACVVCKQLRMDMVEGDSVIWAIRNDRQLPPLITVTGTADHQESAEVAIESEPYQEAIYVPVVHRQRRQNGEVEVWIETKFSHFETRWRQIREHQSEWTRVSDGGGHFHGIPGNRIEKHTVWRTVELWRYTEEYKYVSWQENGQPVQFPRAQLLQITVECNLIFDQSAEAQVAELRQQLHNEGRRHDTHVDTFVETMIPQFATKLSGTLKDQEVRKIQERYGGCCGFTFWTLCLVTGYQAHDER
jgi:hypothetical protein